MVPVAYPGHNPSNYDGAVGKMKVPDVTLRFNVHGGLDEATLGWMSHMRRQYAEAAREIDLRLPACREAALAITKLEEAMFWTSAAAARSNGEPGGYGDYAPVATTQKV